MRIRTIMIFPRFNNIEIINDIRKQYDPLANLVLPHITLVFPFNDKMSDNELKIHLKLLLNDVKSFQLELKGFDKQVNSYGNYLFLNVGQGIEEIKDIHNILYSGKLSRFKINYDYIPHMTIGKLNSIELLDKAYENINKYNCKFRTIINKIHIEMIGNHEESIIIGERELK